MAVCECCGEKNMIRYPPRSLFNGYEVDICISCSNEWKAFIVDHPIRYELLIQHRNLELKKENANDGAYRDAITSYLDVEKDAISIAQEWMREKAVRCCVQNIEKAEMIVAAIESNIRERDKFNASDLEYVNKERREQIRNEWTEIVMRILGRTEA